MLRKETIYGIEVIYEYMPNLTEFSVFLQNKTGSSDESDKNRGHSHFVEHMLFKGTKNRNNIEIVRDLEKNGVYINAYTTKNNTVYYVRSLEHTQDISLDVLFDLYTNSTFLDEEFEKEKNVILEEINMYEDNVESKLFTNDSLNVYNGTYKYPILGSYNQIKETLRDDLYNYYLEKYIKENTSIYVSGNFSVDLLKEKIKKYFENFRSGQKNNTNKNFSFNAKENIFFEDNKQVNIVMSYNLTDKVNNSALMILNSILTGAMSSYLFLKIREELALAYSIYSYIEKVDNNYILKIYIGTNKEKYRLAIDSVDNELLKLLNQGITDEDLEYAKNTYEAKIVFTQYNTSARAKHILNTDANNDMQDLETTLSYISVVKKEDVEKELKNLVNSKKSVSISGKI